MERTKRIGMIVPSSNTCLEPQTYRILNGREDVTVHFTRIGVTKITLESDASSQFDHSTMVEAAQLLATADVDVIAWNGTAGSWLGLEHDRKMAAAMSEATDLPSTTSTLAYFDAFERFGITNIGLITPYTSDVNEAIVKTYSELGIKITDERHLGMHVNESFARVPPNALLDPSRELTRGDSDIQALTYVCTNLYGAPIVKDVESETKVPVLDSVAVTLWRCLDLIGLKGLDARWGQLLT